MQRQRWPLPKRKYSIADSSDEGINLAAFEGERVVHGNPSGIITLRLPMVEYLTMRVHANIHTLKHPIEIIMLIRRMDPYSCGYQTR